MTFEERDAAAPMQVFWVPIDLVKPYPRNARKNDETVKSVTKSISEFGPQRALVVDRDLVIVVGHSQHKAMGNLKYDKVPVIFAKRRDATWLSEAQCRAYRIKDNRDHEKTTWKGEELLEEILDLEEKDPLYDRDFLGFDIKKLDEPAKKEEWDYDKVEDHFVVTIRGKQNIQAEVVKRLADIKDVEIQVSQMKQPRKK